MTGQACKRGAFPGCPLFFLLFSPPLAADVFVDELERLDFGTMAIPANNSVSELVLPRSGLGISIEGDIVPIEPATSGRYRLSGFPPNTSVDVTLDDTDLTAESGLTEPLAIDQYDFNDVFTSDAGEAELQLGARLQTSGTGNPHEDDLYTGATIISFEYWEPDAQQFVTSSEVIELETEVRTSLNLEEVQGLHFGTLFARTGPGDQASMTLGPDGSLDINNPGNSRLVLLTDPEVGVVQVSGAAANFSLTIVGESNPVLLQNTDNPGSAPHFILDPLVTAPENSGTTDTEGFLEVRVGGTLTTEATSTVRVYPDGIYEGTYELTISY